MFILLLGVLFRSNVIQNSAVGGHRDQKIPDHPCCVELVLNPTEKSKIVFLSKIWPSSMGRAMVNFQPLSPIEVSKWPGDKVLNHCVNWDQAGWVGTCWKGRVTRGPVNFAGRRHAGHGSKLALKLLKNSPRPCWVAQRPRTAWCTAL